MNYFKLVTRNFARSRTVSFINIFGLGLGMACSLCIYLWVRDELRFDKFHAHKDQLYKVFLNDKDKDGSIVATFDATPGRLAEILKLQIPEVEHAVTMEMSDGVSVGIDEKITRQKGCYASPEFFRMFTFPLVQGDADQALVGPDNVVISERLSGIYFGGESPVGKTLRINGKDHRVSGLMANVPRNSSLAFDLVLPVKNLFDDNPWMIQGWDHFGPQTYILLRPDASPRNVNAKLGDILARQDRTVNGNRTLSVQPFKDTYLYSQFTKGIPDGGRIEYVRLFSIIAVFVLVLACINFMNLATAQSVKRAREVGVRKAIGAQKRTLVGQFLAEAILITLVAGIVTMLAALPALPLLNQLTGKDLSIPVGDPYFDLAFLVVIVVTGCVAGSYPAFFLSSLNPVAVLKGAPKFNGGSERFRKGLVIFQFSMSIALVVCTLVVNQQMHYIQTKNLGINRDNIIYMPMEGDLVNGYEAFRRDLLQTGQFEDITRGSGLPTNIGMHTESVDWPGKDPGKKEGFWEMAVSFDFSKTMKVQFVDGRDFDRQRAVDSGNFLINESAANQMKLRHPVGTVVSYDGKKGEIIGVIKDFHFRSLHEAIAPLFISFQPANQGGVIIMRVNAGRTSDALAQLENAWKRYNPRLLFEYIFADDLFSQQYKSEKMVEQLANAFSGLAIFISCMGLFGLAMFMAQQRTREISIRKVLGARTTGIIALLSRDFMKLVAISALIAFPIAWFAMHKWLDDFVYRIKLGWWYFALAGMGAILIALLTIGLQTIKAALVNPVKNLRSE
jgi:predicted permease